MEEAGTAEMGSQHSPGQPGPIDHHHPYPSSLSPALHFHYPSAGSCRWELLNPTFAQYFNIGIPEEEDMDIYLHPTSSKS